MLDEGSRSPFCGGDCAVCAQLRQAVVRLGARSGLESVEPEALALAAGIDPSALEHHRDGDLKACMADALLEGTARLQAAFMDRLALADTWCDGLDRAIAGLVEDAEEQPELVRFCCVDVLSEDRDLHALRHEARERVVIMLGREWMRRHAGAPPLLHLELLYGAIDHALSSWTNAEDEMTLVARLEGVRFLALAGAPASSVVA